VVVVVIELAVAQSLLLLADGHLENNKLAHT
jgi:hypothetical protein